MRLPQPDAHALEEAAIAHHQPELLRGPAFLRLMGDLGMQANVFRDQRQTPASLADRVLAAFHSRRPIQGDERAGELAAMLYASNCFDEQLEYAPYEETPPAVEPVHAGSREPDVEEAIAFVTARLRCADRSDLSRVLPKLPVYPAIAMRLYRLLGNEEVNLDTLAEIAKSDQVIAGKIVKAANSVYYSPRQPIRTVAQAINYVGTQDARRLLLASSVQPLFAAPRMRRLWKHAVEAGQVAETIATLSGKVDPAEAFLIGLLHDVGKLAISLMSKEVNDALDRLLTKGCAPSAAEIVLCGFDHAEAGSEVLRFWNFADELVSAVRHHHEPERTESRLSSVLYLTEFWTDSEEDLPSNARLCAALDRVGLRAEVLEDARIRLNSSLASL